MNSQDKRKLSQLVTHLPELQRLAQLAWPATTEHIQVAVHTEDNHHQQWIQSLPAWEYHLQMLTFSPNPTEYLRSHTK